jgi:iron complex outermembrane receptor protein
MKIVQTAFIAGLCMALFPDEPKAQDMQEGIRTQTIDTVVVTGSRTQTNRSNVPVTISVIGREEIEESGESSVLSVLSGRVPGLFITERGVTGFGVSAGGTGGITIRGVGGSPTTEVLVLIDGHPQYMGVMGHPLPDAYIASDVEKIEIVRGPASMLYGSNAMGGVINLISRRQQARGWKINARSTYGSFNTQKYSLNLGLKGKRFDSFVSVNHDRTDGHRENSPFQLTSFCRSVGYRPSEHFYVRANANMAWYKAQNPGDTTNPVLENVADIFRGEVGLTLENSHAKNDGALKLFYNFGNHSINNGYPMGGTPRSSHFKSNDHNYGALLYQSVRLAKGNTLTAGVDYKNYGGFARQADAEAEKVLIDTSLYEAAVYLTLQQILFDKVTLNAGGRYEYNQLYGGEWAPQAGVTYAPLRTTVLKASVAKGYRSPTLREMFMFVPIRNPDLQPERMWNYEISWEQRLPGNRLSFELTGFIADGSGLIQVEKGQNINRGKFRNSGLEAAVGYQPLQYLYLHGNYSFLYMPEGKRVAYAPEQMLSFSASYIGLKKWHFNAGCRYVKDVYSNVVDEGVKSSYGLLDARVSYRPLRMFEVFVKGENLTDADYEIVTGYPMPGITVMAGINLSI